MKLKKSVIDKLKTNKESKYIDEIKELFKFFDENFIKALNINFNKRPKNFIGQNFLVFLQTNLYRSRLLCRAYLEGLNTNNPLSSILALRALFETTGSLALSLKKYNQYLQKNIIQQEFEEVLRSLYLGIKDKQHLEGAPDPQNAMKLIDSVDHFLKKSFGLKGKLFRDGYDFLSEICHPNSFGYMLGHKIVDKGAGVIFTSDFDTHNLDSYHLEYFSIASELYIDIYSETKQLIIKNEEIPYYEFQTNVNLR
jgi:hypothetical protein